MPTIFYCQETAVTESGKKVQLNKNGTYKYLKESKLEATSLKDSDMITHGDQISFKEKPFYILNGDEKLVDVKFIFSCSLNRYSSMTTKDLNVMIGIANLRTSFNMKNKRTYVPRKIMLFFSEKTNEWVVTTEYVAQNDYGALKDGTSFTTFDELGAFKNIIID
jgi:hypothetical protein